MRYVALLRGINVGGKNKVSMGRLKTCLEDIGFSNVSTYIASGNIIFDSDKNPPFIQSTIEKLLSKNFNLDSKLIKVLILTKRKLQAVIKHKPRGFGEQPNKYHSDAIFLMGINETKAMSVFRPKEGVDRIWRGKGVIYSERLSAMRTKSRLNKIMISPLYKSMTIRNWNTTTTLLKLVNEL